MKLITERDYTTAKGKIDALIADSLGAGAQDWITWHPCSYADVIDYDDTVPLCSLRSSVSARAIIFHFSLHGKGPALDVWSKHWSGELAVDYLNVMAWFSDEQNDVLRRIIRYWSETSETLDAASDGIRRIVDESSKSKSA